MLAGGSVCPGERKESFVIESENRKVWRWHERGIQVRTKGSWSGRKRQWQNYCQFCIWQEASIFRAKTGDVVLSGFSKNKSCSVTLNLLKMWELFKPRQYTAAVVKSIKDEEKDELNSDIFCQVQSQGNTLPEFTICSPKNRGNMVMHSWNTEEDRACTEREEGVCPNFVTISNLWKLICQISLTWDRKHLEVEKRTIALSLYSFSLFYYRATMFPLN